MKLKDLYSKGKALTRLIRKKTFKEFFQSYVFNSNQSKGKIVLGVFVGVFIGLSPYYGIKTISSFLISLAFNLNKLLTIGLVYTFGMPFLIPFSIFFSHEIGAFILQNNNHLVFANRNSLNVDFVVENLVQQLVGGTVYSITLALLISFIFYILISLRKKTKDAA